MDPASAGEASQCPTIPVEQDHDGDVPLWRPFLSDLRTADAQQGRLSTPGSMAGEDEWHLVSPNASQGAASRRSSRASMSTFEDNGQADQQSVASEAAAQHEALADSLLGQPLGASPAFAADAVACDVAIATAVSEVASEAAAAEEAAGEEEDEPAAAAAVEVADAQPAVEEGAPPAQPRDGVRLPAMLASKVAAAVAHAQGAAVEQAGAIGSWVAESVAALVQAARMTPDRMQAVLSAAAGQLWQLLPKRDAKEQQVAWSMVAAASGCVLLAATTVLTLVKNYRLRHEVLSRDRELAKLVMRVVSLQEVLQQSRHLPITRYTSYGFAHTCL